MEKGPTFFDFAAEVGLTKHIGSVKATEELAELCHLRAGQIVLDVGCGAGVTACYLAKRYQCRVVGVDIVEKMVERSRERALKEHLADLVEFRVGDAQALPFEDNTFDAVITESVTAFPPDKQKAVKEYARVTKPGGYIGLNESTWLKEPPPPEIIAWVQQDIGFSVVPLSPTAWQALLEGAGLTEIETRIQSINTQEETRGILQRYGCGGILGVLWRTFKLYLRDPAYRRFVKKVQGQGVLPQNLDEYFGYGLFVGRK